MEKFFRPLKIFGISIAFFFAISHVYSQRQEGLAWSEVHWWIPLCILGVAAFFWSDMVADYVSSRSDGDDHDQNVG